MSILINVSEIRKSFAARPLFDGLSFSIESGERIGLIGPNGAGKSTLLRILASQTTPDEGTVSFQRGLRVGFLEQTPQFLPDATVLSTILEGCSDPQDWQNQAQAHEIISKLSLSESNDRVSQLSGGWKKRVALGRELMRNPDLLLLDEPTNHLDLESIFWLEEFLAHSSFATLTITHDRAFLQKVGTRILELDRRNPNGILSIQGDYATYLETKEQVLAAQERREVVLKNTLRRETEWLRRGAKARTTKQQARIQRAESLKDEVSELESRNQTRTVRLDFQSSEKNPKKLLEAKNLSKSYENRVLFQNLDLTFSPGKRLGVLGANGCGKSTLIRVLMGEETPDQGDVFRAENLSIAYFQQNREALDPNLTVAKTICPTGDFVSYRGERIHIRSYLDRFLFSQGQMDMAVGKLSGGEQSRLLIAQLMLQPANFLILDEPTNDLDLATLGVLEDCLLEFQGSILLVTHDRYFLDQVANQILTFHPKSEKTSQTLLFADLDQWETWYRNQEAASKSTKKDSNPGAGAQPNALTPPSGGISPKKKKLSFKDQRDLDTMESRIQAAESELARLTEESIRPENTSNASRLLEITTEMTRLQNEIDRLYTRWSELEAP